MRALLDTNAALYLLGGRLADPLEPGEYFVSVISEIELLSYPAIDSEAEHHIREFLSSVSLVELTRQVKDLAIELRRQRGLRLPDAVVAASAIALDVDLLTNDAQLLRVPEVRARALALKETT